jgi:hypothetical protein
VTNASEEWEARRKDRREILRHAQDDGFRFVETQELRVFLDFLILGMTVVLSGGCVAPTALVLLRNSKPSTYVLG